MSFVLWATGLVAATLAVITLVARVSVGSWSIWDTGDSDDEV